MTAALVYLVSPLVMISIYAWFLFHLQRLLLILSYQPKVFAKGRSLMDRLEEAGMHALAWITVPLAFTGLWLHYLLRRDWTVTGFHIVFLTLSIFMAVIFHRSSRTGGSGTVPLRQQVKISGIVCVVPVVLVLLVLSFGVIKGTPERHLKRDGDFHALVPWLFHKLGYDVFFDFREQSVSKLPDDYWQIKSESDRMSAIQGAPLKKADLRYADFYQAFVVKANLRNAKLREARLREADFRNADLRGAKLKIADLRQGNFHGADFREAILEEANLGDADLRNTQLGLAVFRKADFNDAKLTGADLRCADLSEVKNLSIETLKTVKTLYRARLDNGVRERLQKIKKELFDKPPDTWYDMTTPYNVDRKDICK